jgi:LysR family nitrogen assimilation transcriptional regulator
MKQRAKEELTIRQMRLFLTVAEAGSMSGAALTTAVAQPSLSRLMSQLEGKFGAKLFRRHGRGVQPTSAGFRLQHHFSNIVAHYETAESELLDMSDQLEGECRIVMPDGAGRMLLVPLIKHFNEHHPHLALRVMMAFRKTIPELIATGQVDLGIVFDTHPLPGIVAEPLATENMHLVGQVGEKVLRRATITTQEIAPLPLLLTGFEGGIRTIADKAFSAAGVTPNVKLEVDANDALLDLISEGLGFAILPYCTIQREIVEGRCAAAEIISPTIPRIVLLAISSSRLIAPATREAARAI